MEIAFSLSNKTQIKEENKAKSHFSITFSNFF